VKRSAPLLIGLLIAISMALLARVDFMTRLELRLLDYRYVLRDDFPLAPVPVSKDIVEVMIDGPTLERIKEPTALWLPIYARAFKGMLDGGATAVGLDMVLSYGNDEQLAEFGKLLLESPPDGDRPYLERVVLIGYMEYDDMSETSRMVKPVDALMALVGAPNVALANLTRDSDGIPRAQQVIPIPVPDADNSAWSPFAALLAEKHSGRRIEARSGAFGDVALPLLEGRRLLINYTGARPQFRRVSFAEVVDRVDKHDAAWLSQTFKGKVALIGPGSVSFQDFSETPYSAGGASVRSFLTTTAAHSMLGVDIQANILNTLLTGAWLYRAPPWADAALLLVVCLATALVAARMPALRGALASLALIAATFVFGYWMFAARQTWIGLAAPMTAIPLVWGGVYARRYAVEEKEKRHIRDIFGKYVSNEVMEELLADPDNLKLGGERRDVTVLFSDINGFTTASESLPPETVVRMLNRYLDEMTRIVFLHDGTLEQYVGDEIMLLFGAPQTHPEAEKAAIRTALDMIKRLEELRRLDASNGAEPGFYDVKIGIHTGRPIIGNIGTADRVQYTAIGDMVNLASRIMNMTKQVGGTILISETTYERVKDMPDVEFVDHGEQEVRGRQNTVRVYEVRAAKNALEVSADAVSAVQS
jgi:adenylate cyclase